MVEPKTLKRRIRDGEPLHTVRTPITATREQLTELLKQGSVDMFYVDCQHGPFSELALFNICNLAEELGKSVQLRIKHPRQAYLLGNFLDLGPLSIKVPTVEDEATVREAIESFYFPPFGKRSWGGKVGYKIQEQSDRLTYAEWWNNHGILCMKLESVNAITNVRKLAKAGVDYFDFGPMDLQFDLEQHDFRPFKTVEECRQHVQKELEGTPVRLV